MGDVTEPIATPGYTLPEPPPGLYYVAPPTLAEVGPGSLLTVEESDPFDCYTYRLRAVLHQGRTAFQSVLIADTINYGLALFLDGVIQSSADDEALYHELLVQPAMLRHPEPRDVLILGGGEGAALREVVAHRSVRSVTMVDIDRELVELCRTHLAAFHRGAFDDPRVRLIHADGRGFLEQDDAFYDVVILNLVDLLDSDLADALYTQQFYRLLRRRLRPGAIVAVQGLEFSCIDDKPHAALARTLRTVFAEVHSYQALIPSFLAGWGFLLASDWARPQDWTPAEIDRVIEQRLGTWLDHLNGEFLRGCFAHCQETLFALAQPGPILEDGVPFVAPPHLEEIAPTLMQFPVLPG